MTYLMTLWQDMQKELDELAAAGLLRRPVTIDSACGPRVRIDGRDCVALCSNDYLGLADHPAVKAAAIEAVGRYGVGAGASRLVSGTCTLHAQLEGRLAAFKGTPAAVVAPTGWMANHIALHAMVGAGDLVLCDKLNHASIVEAALSCGARLRTYPHCDAARLGELLARHRGGYRRCLIVTDSLFSMDGDLAPLREIVQLKRRYDAQLLLDEAHATGVLGASGRGAAELAGVEGDVDATVGTLSKAIGAMGGFVAGPAVLIDLIRNKGRAFIYTTALPPAICGAALAALDLIRDEPQRRTRLWSLSAGLRLALGQLPVQVSGANVANRGSGATSRECSTPIIPVVIGEASRAVAVSEGLLKRGFLVPAIRPPTVPRGTSHLRVSVSAAHDEADLQRFVHELATLLA